MNKEEDNVNFVYFELGDNDYCQGLEYIANNASSELDLNASSIDELKHYAVKSIIANAIHNSKSIESSSPSERRSLFLNRIGNLYDYLNTEMKVFKVRKLVELGTNKESCYIDLATGKGYIA